MSKQAPWLLTDEVGPACTCDFPDKVHDNPTGHDGCCPAYTWAMAHLDKYQKWTAVMEATEQKPMRIILCQDGVKRELLGGFEVCGGYGDLQRVAEAILAKVKPYGESVPGYGWIEIPDRVHAGGVNTPPKPWKE